MDHDMFGCSRHDGLLQCLGYTPKGEAGAAAERGSEMHAIAEQILKGERKEPFPDVFKTGEKFTEEHKRIILTYVEDVIMLINKYKEAYGNSVEVYFEKAVSILQWDVLVTTIDTLIYVPFKTIHVIDFKTGDMPVSPYSAQLKGYLVGAQSVGPAEEYYATIIQPSVGGMKTAKYSPMEIERHDNMMSIVLDAARKVDPPMTPCKYCSWCARAPECPANKAQLALIATEASGKELSNVTLARLTEYAMRIEDYIGELKQRAHAVLEAGGRLKLGDGREVMLVDGRITRVWSSEKEAEGALKELAKQKGMSEEDIFEVKRTMLSPAGADKLFGKSAAIRKVLEPLVYQKPGNKKLGIVKTGGEINEQ